VAPSTPAQARERIERICAVDQDERTLRLRLLDEIRREVPFDAYAWVLTDPETTVGSAPLADVPALAELPELIRLRYCTSLNRWTTLGDDPVALLAKVTGGRLDRSLIWRDMLRRYDVADVASVVFRDRFGCWAFLELWRTGGRTFGPDDAALLRAVVVPVTTALRRSAARTFAAASTASLPGPLVLLLTPGLAVARQTPRTADPLRHLVPRDDAGPTVPAGAYNVAAQLLAVEAGVDGHEPRARVHLADGLWLSLRAARLGADDGDIAVTIEPCAPADRLALFGRCCGLSVREQELLGHLAAGRDTRELAALLFLSAHTVQDHLKSVFDKTGTRSRRALLARALGG
jgi:DNA-binding CsgD family transcriptional regulator